MGKIHPGTSLGLIFLAVALFSFYSGYVTGGLIFCILGFFSALSEVAKFTSTFQFVTIFLCSGSLGWLLDTLFGHPPFMTVTILVIAANCLGRILFFSHFSYTGYSWFEPFMAGLALTCYLCCNFFIGYGWQGFVFPLPLLLFAFYFSWNILKDKSQLLQAARGGYKIKIGQIASDFELPDQDGQPVRLSSFKTLQHVLLIFVRGDWCPGCHMMLRTYEKNNEKFKSKNIMVMAIGPDPVGVNREMISRLGLDYKVLSDEHQRTAMTYGVQLKDYKNQMATEYKEGIPLPASFLIDKNGVVRYVSRPDKVGEFLNPSSIFPIVEQLN